MRVGYARVSTDDQAVDVQLDALRVARCAKIFIDEGVSKLHRSRRGLDRLLSTQSPGDVLVTWKLDRLGRSLSHLLVVLETPQDKGVSLVSLTEGMDTATASGPLLFKRALIAERTLAGLRAARARGQRLGRPNKLLPDDAEALKLQYSLHGNPIGELA